MGALLSRNRFKLIGGVLAVSLVGFGVLVLSRKAHDSGIFADVPTAELPIDSSPEHVAGSRHVRNENGCSCQVLTPAALLRAMMGGRVAVPTASWLASKFNPSEQAWFASEWAQFSNEALLFAWRQSQRNPSSALFKDALRPCASLRPGELSGFFASHPELAPARLEAVALLMSGGDYKNGESLAVQDPAALKNYVMIRTARDEAFDPLAFLQRLKGQGVSDPLFSTALESLAASKTGSPADLSKFVEDAAGRGWLTPTTVALVTAQLAPEQALNWLKRAGLELEDSQQAATSAFQSFLARDTASAARWLNENSDVAFRDSLISELCFAVAGSQKELALQWAALVEDEDAREELMGQIEGISVTANAAATVEP